jgi:hypothetical protein
MKRFFKNAEKNEKIISLNTDLYDEFFVQELEYRLETDPLTLVGLMDLFPYDCNGHSFCQSHCIGLWTCGIQCSSNSYCGEYSTNYA